MRPLAESIAGWLVDVGVLGKDPSDCALGNEPGYPAGPNFRSAIADPDRDGGFLTLWTNGVEVSAGRLVFHPGAGELGAVSCPRCSPARSS